MILPPAGATDDEVAAWVRMAILALDDTPTRTNWRYRAIGSSVGEALAQAPDTARLGMRIPVGEWRIVREIAARRALGVEVLARRALGTWMVAVERVEPRAIPHLTRGGMLGP